MKIIPIIIMVTLFISAIFQLAENASNDAHEKMSVYTEYYNGGK